MIITKVLQEKYNSKPIKCIFFAKSIFVGLIMCFYDRMQPQDMLEDTGRKSHLQFVFLPPMSLVETGQSSNRQLYSAVMRGYVLYFQPKPTTKNKHNSRPAN